MPGACGAGWLRCVVAPPHCLHEGVTYLGIGYGTFILDHTPVRGFLDAEVSVDTQSQRRGSATVESLNRMEKAWRVRPACWRFFSVAAARKREQAPRTPNASRNSAADRNVSAPQPMRMSRRDA